MAQLNGVVRVGSGGNVIEYNGKSYVRVSGNLQAGDIVLVTEYIREYIQTNGFYMIYIDYEGVFLMDEDGDEFLLTGVCDLRSVDVYRAELSTEALLAAKREELVKITATIAELEAKLADEKTLKVGDYARHLITGQVVRVVVDDQSTLPLKTVPALDTDESDFYVWNIGPQLVKLTPTEAKAAILAQVEAQFKEVA